MVSGISEDLLQGDLDLYEFLGVDEIVDRNEIRKNYRRKALLFHPDKNPSEEAAVQFQLLSQIYEILTDEGLRKKYDELRKIKLNKQKDHQLLSERIRNFKEELEKAERQHEFDSKKVYDNSSNEYVHRKAWENRLELLREEGLKKRRMRDKLIRSKTDKINGFQEKYTSFQSLPSYDYGVDIGEEVLEETGFKITLVKWKYKPELEGLFTHDMLEEIMAIFGPVKRAEILHQEGPRRYDTGLVEFEHLESALKAVKHDYRKSATLWDGTRVRKLASLLRDCKPQQKVSSTKPDLDLDLIKVANLIEKSRGVVDIPRPDIESIKNTAGGHNPSVDKVFHELIAKEIAEMH